MITRLVMERNVMVPMRDGVRLATDIYRPEADGPVPALVVRTPYSKETTSSTAGDWVPNILRLTEAGYAVIWQDVRGTFASEGTLNPLRQETRDGEDLLAWLADQPWCNGRFGGYGLSYLGLSQWHLSHCAGVKAIAPANTTADYYRGGFHHEGGLVELQSALNWSIAMALFEAQRRAAAGSPLALANIAAAAANPVALAERLPLTDSPVNELAPWYLEWLSHPECDEYWKSMSPAERADPPPVPGLHIAGWFDMFLNASLEGYVRMKNAAASEEVRRGQRLIVGPWAHTREQARRVPGAHVRIAESSPANVRNQDVHGVHLRFFDRWMRERKDVPDGGKPVRIFVMGINQWRDEDDWPLPDTTYVPFHLHSGGRANGASGDGILSGSIPEAANADIFLYDPRRPVPTLGGHILPWLMGPDAGPEAGPADLRSMEGREDVLCYTTAPLERPLEVTGPIELVLFFSSSAKDTDVIAKLVDVDPDDRALLITEGALRLRYRESVSAPKLMEPGNVYQIRFKLWPTSNVFLAGHKLRLNITSSNFPRFDRNTNTGGKIASETEADLLQALNRVHHGPRRPSRLILPIIDRR